MSSRERTICFVAVAGSATFTQGLIADEIRRRFPETRIVVFDTEHFNTRTRSPVVWPTTGEIVKLSYKDAGLVNFTEGTRLPVKLNFAANGGGFALKRMISRFRKIVRDTRPDVVVTCNDTFFVQLAVLRAAQLEGVPTALVQEGPFCIVQKEAGTHDRTLSQTVDRMARKLGLTPQHCAYGAGGHSLVLAASEDYARRFAEIGIPETTIKVAGVPRFDAIEAIKRPPPAEPRLLYVFQPFVGQHKVSGEIFFPLLKEMAAGLNALHKRMPFEFVLRAHHRADPVTFDFFAGLLDFPAREDTSLPLPEALANCTASIGHYSTGLIESVLVDRPVLCVPVPTEAFTDIAEGEKQDWFTKVGFLCATTARDIELGLEAVLTGNCRHEPDISTEAYPTDGKAVARAADAIIELLSPFSST